MVFRKLLRDAGRDPVMQTVQDSFFDRVYWQPAEKAANRLKISSALGAGVVYDSHVHGSWHAMRNRTIERFGQPEELGEKNWIRRYVEVRKEWLANHGNTLLHRTVYRMESFADLIGRGNWELAMPFTVRGLVIDPDSLLRDAADPRAADEGESPRILRLRAPYMKGNDVKTLQQILADMGIAVDIDGTFGPGTQEALITFQKRASLKADGIAGPATRAALEG